jgi:hypothetical protein
VVISGMGMGIIDIGGGIDIIVPSPMLMGN